eukprot:gnl/MRDRNA2_/MRDRNA2_89068_c0_seq1.p1 gnl/MRDRNA2_/MRDRNA2_89068_c0~~gnl/MRDRNA2_/MRDRNA2_89068_c0_seq1.p1  ORF type:complete len:266 (+),score=30.10 gnl/MRDRNA2_/MRDRNA2_89068_c0_seq1:69-866(+)
MMRFFVPFVVALFPEGSAIAPEKGDKLPSFPKSFPGCSCKWSEPGWTCTGNAVFPKEVKGNTCCCCGVQCSKAHRCGDDACFTIGVDQKQELAEEQKRIDELLKGADMLLGDTVPGFVVDLGQGMCTSAKIQQKCNEKGLTPICDHSSYANGKCYSMGNADKKFFSRHLSHWSSHRALMGFNPADDGIFYGMCFYTSSTYALAPYSSSHFWTNGNVHLTPWGGGNKNLPRNINPTARQMDACLKKESSGLGCWRTLCVKESPTTR